MEKLIAKWLVQYTCPDADFNMAQLYRAAYAVLRNEIAHPFSVCLLTPEMHNDLSAIKVDYGCPDGRRNKYSRQWVKENLAAKINPPAAAADIFIDKAFFDAPLNIGETL